MLQFFIYLLSEFIVYPKLANNTKQEQKWKELFVIFQALQPIILSRINLQ